VKLEAGVNIIFVAPSGNIAHASVRERGELAALTVGWMNEPSIDDMRGFDERVSREFDVDVDFSGQFGSRKIARAAEDAFLRGPS